jgi:hypothetical protein
MRKFLEGAAVGAGLLVASAGLPAHADGDGGFGGNSIKRVLLISIDGMHAVDFLNCSQGISGINGGNPYCPSLAELAGTGVNYLDTSTSKPSDSFPGLMALVTGGSPAPSAHSMTSPTTVRSIHPRRRRGTAWPERRAFARPGQPRWARPRNSTRELISTRPS